MMNERYDFGIAAFDIATEHIHGYTVDKKVAPDRHILMCFKTPFLARTINGVEEGAPGDILINAPGFFEYHTNHPDSDSGFCNSWMHCRGSFVGEILEKYNIPVNVILKTGSPFFFDAFLKSVHSEQSRAQAFYEEAIRNDFERLIIDLARQLYIIHTSDRQYYSELLKIRQQMMSDVSSKHTLSDLARRASLSVSRFSHLYKEFFGISPMDDLMKTRLRTAEKLLLTTDMRIEAIALECGFSNAAHFSKMFRHFAGQAPSRFRNN